MGMKATTDASAVRGSKVTVRAVLIALLLIPLNAYWHVRMESVFYIAHPTLHSLFFNVVAILFAVICVNVAVRAVTPRLALRQGELTVIYVMLSQATAITGLSFLQILPPTLAASSVFATAENDWANLFGHLIPDWLAVNDRKALWAFHPTASKIAGTFFAVDTLRVWMVPLLVWSGFVCVLLFVKVCFNAILRKQWSDREKLTFPIVQLPSEMVDESGTFFRSRLMWLSFTVVGLVDVVSGLHTFIPSIPILRPPWVNLAPMLFRTHPWSAIGELWLGFMPMIFGLIFLIPVHIQLSCWVLFFFWRAQLVLGEVTGMRQAAEFPEQSMGTYVGLALIGLWIGRRHFGRVLAGAWRSVSAEDDARDEPMSYRLAVGGLFIGFSLLALFAWQAGMALWVAVAFLVLYFVTEVGVVRVRAEVGSPTHDLHFAGPEVLMVDALGTRSLGARNLTIMSFFWFLTRAHYSDVMPHQLEAYRMADRARMRQRHMTVVLVIGLVVSTFVALVILVSEGYRNRTVYSWLGTEPFVRLQGWLVQPRQPDMLRVGYFIGGVLFTFFLMFMRTRFLWWPLHPAGYAVSSTYQMRSFWSLFLLAWLCKWTIVRWGGVRGLRTATPLFMGMVLGDFVVGSFWGLLGAMTGIHTFGIV